MKRLNTLLITSAILATATGYAAPISPDEAEAKASLFFSGAQLESPVFDNSKLPQRLARSMSRADKPFYLFNREGGGFVIIGGDDRMPSVLGYSMSGSVNPDDMPEQLSLLLEMNAEYSCTATTSGAMSLEAGTPVVSPLLGEINWGQDYPFNAQCPAYGSSNYYVGCVATAATQIMKYYNYPAHGTGEKSYTWNNTTLSADFGNTTYDWANMPPVMPDNPSDAQIQAASTLAYHFGVSVEMDYMAGGSGAHTMLVPAALKDYFGYDSSLRMHSRSYYDTDEWMGMIRSELDEGRPVYYAATSDDRTGGHAFVCDGYDTAGYVHINWGWYGRSNGYFLINHLNPSDLGEGGGSGGYNVAQEIITGFAPAGRIPGSVDIAPIYGASRFACSFYGSDITVMTFAENLDPKAFAGEILAVLTDGDNIIATLKSEPLSIDGFKDGRSGATLVTMRDIPVKVSGVADGTYALRLAFRRDQSEPATILRHSIGLPAYATCSVVNGTIAECEQNQPVPDVTLTSALQPDGDLYVNGSARFTVTLRNDSRDFRLSQIVLRLEPTGGNADAQPFETTFEVNIYDRSEESLILSFDLDETVKEGDYEVTLYHNGYPDNIFDDSTVGRTVVTVGQERVSPVVRLTAPIVLRNYDGHDEILQGDRLILGLSLKNYGAAGKAGIIARLTETTGSGKGYVFIAAEKEVAKGETFTLTPYNTITPEPGDYLLSLYYLDENGAEQPVTGAECPTISISPNSSIPVEVTEFNMPDHLVAGERIAASITIRARAAFSGRLYIRLRQYTNTNGEIAYMSSTLSLAAGEEKTLPFNYTPKIEDGQYMTIVETKQGVTTLPAGNHPAYYREITVGEKAGVGEIVSDGRLRIVRDGDIIRAISTGHLTSLTVTDISGRVIHAGDTAEVSVSSLAPGIYIVTATADGQQTAMKIAK